MFNWIAFLPPILSIYLLLISGFARSFIMKDIGRFAAGDPGLHSKQTVIQNVALSWATELGFFNSMFASIFSVLSIYSQTQNFGWPAATLGILLAIFIPMFWWIRKYEPDELEATTVWRNKNAAWVCKIVLLIVNALLLCAIAVSQFIAAQPKLPIAHSPR